MNKIAQFHKVSFEQFKESWDDSFPGASEEEIKEIYDQIKLPKRATRGSAGYDFFSPVDFELKPGETIKIPTGIRVFIESDWVLNIFPRSGLGFKFRLQMNNTVGIIDSDYFYSDNEGHIFVKLTNDTNEGKTVSVHRELAWYRESLCSTELRSMMMQQKSEMVALEVQQNRK